MEDRRETTFAPEGAGKWGQGTDREDERKQEVLAGRTGWGRATGMHTRAPGRAMQERLAPGSAETQGQPQGLARPP